MTIDCAIKLKGWPKKLMIFREMPKIYRAFVFRITFATQMDETRLCLKMIHCILLYDIMKFIKKVLEDYWTP